MTVITPTPLISSTATTPSPGRGILSPHYAGLPSQLPNTLVLPEDMTEPTTRLAMRVRPDKQDFYRHLGAPTAVVLVAPLSTINLPSQLLTKKNDNKVDHSPFLQGYNCNLATGMPNQYASSAMEEWYTLRHCENVNKRLLEDIGGFLDDENDSDESDTDQGRRRKQPRVPKRRRCNVPNQLKR